MRLIFHLLFCFIAVATRAETDVDAFADFLDSCSDGDVERVKTILAEHPKWASEASPEGETCLHVAGIHGEIETTKLLLDVGVDPNIISSIIDDEAEGGSIEMHALSWHVFGGHLATAKLLLDHGADPNKLMDSLETDGKVTVLDMLETLLAEEAASGETLGELDPFLKMKEMLIQRGAKRKEEL